MDIYLFTKKSYVYCLLLDPMEWTFPFKKTEYAYLD